MSKKKIVIVSCIIVLAFAIGGTLAFLDKDPVVVVPVAKNYVVNVWDAEAKKIPELKKDSERNTQYQNLYKNIVANNKMLNINELYTMEKVFHKGEYNFDLKHPYNLVMAIEISSKYKDRTLEKLLYLDQTKIQDLSKYFARDKNGNCVYSVKLAEKENKLEYFKVDKKFLEVTFELKEKSYLIKTIKTF